MCIWKSITWKLYQLRRYFCFFFVWSQGRVTFTQIQTFHNLATHYSVEDSLHWSLTARNSDYNLDADRNDDATSNRLTRVNHLFVYSRHLRKPEVNAPFRFHSMNETRWSVSMRSNSRPYWDVLKLSASQVFGFFFLKWSVQG